MAIFGTGEFKLATFIEANLVPSDSVLQLTCLQH